VGGLRWLIVGALCAGVLAGPAEAAPPANDHFANATTLTGESGLLVATTAEATAETNEPMHAGWPAERSVWFRVNVPEIATYEFGTCDLPGVETVVALYTGSLVSALTPVAADDGGCAPGSFVRLELSPGTYHLAVDDLLAGGGGEFRLRWTRIRSFPSNTAPPTITGDPAEGSTLAANPGTWTSEAGPLSFFYRWERCSGSTCTTVGFSLTYGLGITDVGYTFRVRVTATNRDGSREVTSAGVGPVRLRVPVNHAPPEIEGVPRVGQTLVIGFGGAWEATGLVYANQWQRCTAGLASCASIPGEVGETYDLTAADRGFLIRVSITATNAAGSATAVSAPLGAVLAARVPPRPCVVPRLRGKTLAAARKALVRARCTLGKVRRARSTTRKGRVAQQSAKPGKRLKPKARVGVVLSLGRKR
jgi:PASTA domain